MNDSAGRTLSPTGSLSDPPALLPASPSAPESVDSDATAERRAARREALTGSQRWARSLRVLLLLAVDGAALAFSGGVAYLAWAHPIHHQPVDVYLDLVVLLPLFYLGYAKQGLYPGFGIGAVETLRRLILRTSFIFLVIAAASFAFKLPYVYSRMTFLLAWALSLVAMPLARLTFLKFAHRWHWWGEPAVVVGSGPMAAQAIRSLDQALSIGYRPVAALEVEGSGAVGQIEGVRVWGDLSRAPDVGRQGIRIALLIEDRNPLDGSAVGILNEHFRHVIHVRPAESLPVEGVVVRNLGGILGIEFNNQLLLRRNRLIKRLVDIVLGGVFFLVTLPIVAVAAAAIKITTRAPAFFTQEREGLNGETLRVIKLRTMYEDAEERLARHLEDDPAARAEWEGRFKLARDPRILPVVGRVLRRFSLDELPQLWQVLRGDMSLVGPRPFPYYHLAGFDEEFRRLRRQVRPGLTGLWQVMVRSSGGRLEQQSFDTYYIRNWSIWLDLYILARTLGTVVHGRGAF